MRKDPARGPAPRLSLCLATMNRAAVIGETLASLAAQAEGADLELVVIDGSPDDATERVLAAWRDRLPPVHYRRQPAQGFDRDYCAAVETARGEYCWLIADDDPLLPGAVATVRAAVADEPDFAVLNGEVCDPGLQRVLAAGSLPIAHDRRFGPGEDDAMAAVVLSFLSYVGAVVVKRTLWLGRDPRPYFGTEFVHVGVLMQRPIERAVVAVARPCLRLRFGVAQWTPRFFEVWMFQWPAVVWSIQHLDAARRAAVTRREPWRAAGRLLVLRGCGHYTREHFRRHLAGRPQAAWQRWRCRLIAELPVRWLARRLRRWSGAGGRLTPMQRWELEQVIAGRAGGETGATP